MTEEEIRKQWPNAKMAQCKGLFCLTLDPDAGEYLKFMGLNELTCWTLAGDWLDKSPNYNTTEVKIMMNIKSKLEELENEIDAHELKIDKMKQEIEERADRILTIRIRRAKLKGDLKREMEVPRGGSQ